MLFHKVVAVYGLTAAQILAVKDSMTAEKTFLYCGLPTVNQILYQTDQKKKLPQDSLIAQAWRRASSVPGHCVRHLKVRGRRWACWDRSTCKP